MASKKYWKRKAKQFEGDYVIAEEQIDTQADTIRDLSEAVACAIIIALPAMDNSTTKKDLVAKLAGWYSRFHHLVPDDEEGDDEDAGASDLLDDEDKPVHPGSGNYSSSDDLTLYGVPVRVRNNLDNDLYHLVRRDSGLDANAEDDPVPADQLKWHGKWDDED
jgi:hypothetical protein